MGIGLGSEIASKESDLESVVNLFAGIFPKLTVEHLPLAIHYQYDMKFPSHFVWLNHCTSFIEPPFS